MTPCTRLSDRMPEVALGRARWTTEDERHLAGCAECQAEWAIVATASRLGASLPAADPVRVAALATERARRARVQANSRLRRAVTLVGLAAAAMVALAVWSNRGGRAMAPGGSTMPMPAPIATAPPETRPDSQAPSSPAPRLAQAPGPTLELAIPELDSLPAEALDSILRVLDEPLAAGTDEVQPDESGDQELEHMLAGKEG